MKEFLKQSLRFPIYKRIERMEGKGGRQGRNNQTNVKKIFTGKKSGKG